MIVMDVKIILLSVVMAHMCTATINDKAGGNRTVPGYGASSGDRAGGPAKLKDDKGAGYGYGAGRRASSRDRAGKDYDWDHFFSSNNSSTNDTAAFLRAENYQPIPAEVYGDNCTIIQWISNISVESAEFLKGPVVTRIMPSFYIFIILISLPLNTLALVTFTCKIGKRKPAVIYMSHLACVDLLFTLLLPLKIHYQLNASDWVFGEVACRVLSAAYYCYMYCSILLMMCISVDRLLAVVFPIASLNWRSARKATCVCVLVWLLAIAGTVPLLSMRQTIKIKDVGITCHDAVLNSDPFFVYYVYMFSILSCLYYFLPLVVTLVSYFTIIYVLSAKSEHVATSSSSSSGSRRKAVIMATAVLVEFVVCFAPTNGILLFHCVRIATRGEGDSSYVVYLLVVCLGSSSVLLDPLLYYFGSSQFRQQIKSVFWCRKAKKVTTPSNT